MTQNWKPVYLGNSFVQVESGADLEITSKRWHRGKKNSHEGKQPEKMSLEKEAPLKETPFIGSMLNFGGV